ncbi:MAG: GntR family transcriptional regulator [Bacteroides sp.]|nr:GntR family transcriptional regulator [Bacteroides sp.]MDE6041939.1 GntR family transcriptional regulator [Muribaculaceae bacterium]
MEFNDSNKAIYLQIADAIADDVVMQRLRPDERIPSVREYAASVMVNVNTVMRAYDHLSSLGVIYNKRGLGFFVAPDGARRVKEQRRRQFIDDGGIDRVFKQLQLLDITAAELAEMYSQYLNKK